MILKLNLAKAPEIVKGYKKQVVFFYKFKKPSMTSHSNVR